MNKETGGPAFPSSYKAMGLTGHTQGMTLREYAAIHLRVPDSGNEELDEMIRKAVRDQFAAKAMQGIMASARDIPPDGSSLASWAYELADAMLAERNKEQP